ncbi:PREDICTED: kielin/chordin-like protein, partial [Mesitornis unicolor]|uniref:kielin/chordin-like protein n=1 Tax=Mesitornis unicolor TaxID=54374 RepID=UPI000528ECD0
MSLLQVNGVPTPLPVEVSPKLSINETRGTLWLTQDPEFVIGLSPAGEVTVMVARDLSKGLCGLCGDYDGDAANDLRGPDGKLVGDTVALAKAWRAPDFTLGEISPKRGEITLKRREITPKIEEIIPKKGEISQKIEEIIPK